MATFFQLGDPGQEQTPPSLREDLRRRRPRATAATATELRAALDVLGIPQCRLAQLFAVNPRTVRHWRYGDRRLPRGVGIVLRLLATGTITLDQLAQAAASTPTGTNGGAKPEPPAPLRAAPAPEQSAWTPAKTAALAVLMLNSTGCRWPHNDPQSPNFHFCGKEVVAPPYCERHRARAYLAPRTGSGHGVRLGFVTPGRYGRPSIPGAFSATGVSRAPKILLDRAGGLPGGAPPPA